MNKTVFSILFLFIVFITPVISKDDQFHIIVLSDKTKTIPQERNYTNTIFTIVSIILQQITFIYKSQDKDQYLLRRKFSFLENGLYLGFLIHKSFSIQSIFRQLEEQFTTTFVSRKLFELQSSYPDLYISKIGKNISICVLNFNHAVKVTTVG